MVAHADKVKEDYSSISIKVLPNPFSDRLRIALKLPLAVNGSLQIFNELGQKVKIVYEGPIPKGLSNFDLVIAPGTGNSLFHIFKTGIIKSRAN
jgi:hypothetical protein